MKGKSDGNVLRFGSDVHNCNIVVDCGAGEVTVILREEHRGKTSSTKQSSDYNTIHEVDLSCVYVDT